MDEDNKQSLGIELDLLNKKFRFGALGKESSKIGVVVILVLGFVIFCLKSDFNFVYALVVIFLTITTYAILHSQLTKSKAEKQRGKGF